MQIYLSYRRDESKVVAERINDQLVWRYRAGQVIRNISGSSLQHYTMLVHSAIARSDVVIVVIGQHWLAASDRSGNRVIDDPTDPIHIELADALASNKLIVPLLVHRAQMPAAHQLPADLAAFTLRQGLIVRPDPQFQDDMAKVYAQINTQLAWRPAHPLIIIGGVVTLGAFLGSGIGSFFGGSAVLKLDTLSLISSLCLLIWLTSVIMTLVGTTILCIQRRQYLWLAGIAAILVSGFLAAPVTDFLIVFLTIPLYSTLIILFGIFGKRREFA